MTFPIQSAATGLTVITGLLLWVAEGILPFFQERIPRVSHASVNLGLAAANLTIILPGSFATAAILEVSRPYYPGIGALRLDPATRAIVVLLLLDLWMYLWHRFNHELPFLWRFHSIHHSDRQLDVTSAWRFHPGEIILSETLRIPFLLFIGASGMELVLYTLLMTPVIQLHHSNIRLSPSLDSLLRILIPTPLLHRIHHSILRNEHDSNYGAMLSIWDRLFGTLLIRTIEPATPVGLEGENNPESITSLIKRAFLVTTPR